MKLTSESKLFLGVGIVTALLVCVAAVIFSQPAKPIEKEKLIAATTHTIGNKDAAVWLVEFSDFQCPACKTFWGVVDDLIKRYPDKLLVAYRYYPLDQHPMARKTAVAAQIAGEQGKFWEMATLLFENQETIATSSSDTTITRLANSILPQPDTFTQKLSAMEGNDIVTLDRQFGDSIGISATPTFFLNGRKLELTTVESLKNKVEEQLK